MFRTLIVDDRKDQLDNLRDALRREVEQRVAMESIGSTVSGDGGANKMPSMRMVLLTTPEQFQSGFGEERERWDGCWVYDGDGIQEVGGDAVDERSVGDAAVFMLYVNEKAPRGDYGWLRTHWEFFQHLDTVVMDLNLSGSEGAHVSQMRLGIDLLSGMLENGLRDETFKILYTAVTDVDPAALATVCDPKLCIPSKDLASVPGQIVRRWVALRDRPRGLKESSLPRLYGRLLNWPAGANVGHGLSREGPKTWRQDLLATRRMLGSVATAVQMLAVRSRTLEVEAEVLETLSEELYAIFILPPDGSQNDPLVWMRAFDSAISVMVPERVMSTIAKYCDRRLLALLKKGALEQGAEGSLVVGGFEGWRKLCCSVYLAGGPIPPSWSEGLAAMIQEHAGAALRVEYGRSERARQTPVELFLPRLWMIEFFGRLSGMTVGSEDSGGGEFGFLRYLVAAGDGGESTPVEVFVDVWPCPFDRRMFKAGLILRYGSIECPDLEERIPGSWSGITTGDFAVDSLEYMYDMFVFSNNGGERKAYVCEARENRRGVRARLAKEVIEVWPRFEKSEPVGLEAEEVLPESLTCALVFVFEGVSDLRQDY